MNQNYNHQVRCTTCNRANAPAKLHTYKTHTHVITEAKYVCPLCNSYVKRDIISREPIDKNKDK
jgi:hypothetical protein